MKLHTAMLKVFLVVLIVGVAVGNEEGGARSVTTQRVCPPELSANIRTHIYVRVFDLVKSCGHELNVNLTIFRQQVITSEEIQYICNETCAHQSNFAGCLEEKASNLEVCPNPLVLKFFNIYRDIALKTLEYGCADGAQRMFTIMAWINLNKQADLFQKLQYKQSASKMAAVLRAVESSDVDISSKIFIYYNNVIEFVERANEVNDHQPSKEVIEYFNNEVLKTMKCIHPQEGTLVPCLTVAVDQLSATSVCGVKVFNSTLGMDEVLENELGRCFHKIMTMDAREDNITSDKKAFREEITNLLDRNVFFGCIDDPNLISEICLNETQKHEFGLLVDSVIKGYDAACLEEGKRLADIMYEVYRLKRAGHGHAVWDCVDVVKSARNQLDEHRSSSLNMRFYHELEAFKGCLVVKLGEDLTSVAAATSLIDETLKTMECVGVDDGATVLCESLMYHNHMP